SQELEPPINPERFNPTRRRRFQELKEIPCYPAAQEITLICANFLVELRGFEPLTSAVQPSALDGAAASGSAGAKCRRCAPLEIQP
ncbi:MAG TPA: hypothetical protein VN932_11665, partial [Rhizomicrobium sp.]|nr:hypothetical protein [Rhizomicrobium sp.]